MLTTTKECLIPIMTFAFCVLALEVLFGPDFDLVTSARFLPKSVLGKPRNYYAQNTLWTILLNANNLLS